MPGSLNQPVKNDKGPTDEYGVGPHAITKLCLISVSFFAIGLMLYTAYRYRRDALLLLSRNAFNEPTPEEIRSALAGVNASCATYTFGIKRTANIPFRGQRIILVLGPVGRLRPCGHGGKASLGPNWGFFTSLFALADSTQAVWMAANSDAFSPAYLGAPFSIFWVSVRKLKADESLQAAAVSPGG